MRRIATFGAVVVGVVAIAIAGFNLNGGTGVPPINGSPAPEAAATPGHRHRARSTTLMDEDQGQPEGHRLAPGRSPTSTTGAGDYDERQRLPREDRRRRSEERDRAHRPRRRAVQPRQRRDGAEKQWRAVLAIEPDNVEAHYDLGFMYLSLTPPDIANVKARVGQGHRDRPGLRRRQDRRARTSPASTRRPLRAQRPSAPAPAPSTAPSAAPSASPAASPAPSGK